MTQRIVVTEFLSLDGVMEAPNEWNIPYVDETLGADIQGELDRATALLYGRTTYDAMASAWPKRTGATANRFNDLPKYVVSSTLRETSWAPTMILRGDAVAVMKELKSSATAASSCGAAASSSRRWPPHASSTSTSSTCTRSSSGRAPTSSPKATTRTSSSRAPRPTPAASSPSASARARSEAVRRTSLERSQSTSISDVRLGAALFTPGLRGTRRHRWVRPAAGAWGPWC